MRRYISIIMTSSAPETKNERTDTVRWRRYDSQHHRTPSRLLAALTDPVVRVSGALTTSGFEDTTPVTPAGVCDGAGAPAPGVVGEAGEDTGPLTGVGFNPELPDDALGFDPETADGATGGASCSGAGWDPTPPWLALASVLLFL